MAEYKTLVEKVSILADKKIKRKEYLKNGKLRIVDQGQDLIGGYTNDLSKQIKCDLPVIVFGDHTCSIKYIDFPFAAGADGIKVLKAKNSIILPRYLYYGTQYLVLSLANRGYARHYQYIEKMDLPVCSLLRQERIIAHVEELFSELESVEKLLKEIKRNIKVYRQAVLKEAFASCPQKVTLESVCKHITDGDHMPPPKAKTGIPFIMISNIKNNKICWNNMAYVGSNYYDAIDKKRCPQKGDVLYTVTGSFGIPVKIDFEKKFCFQRHIALLRPNKGIDQNFLYYVMQEPSVYVQATKISTGTAQKTIGLNVLRKMVIPFVESDEEQKRITINIENKMSVCDSIEQTINRVLLQAEAMRRSILKQAFEEGFDGN